MPARGRMFMARRNKWFRQFVIAALCSALASLLVVAVGPGFSKNENASDRGSDKAATANASDNAGGSETASGKSADKDGDHDNSTTTAHEDSHEAENKNDNEHPSGKDRSAEHGKSGNQGKAESNPDDSKGPERFEGGRGDDKAQGPGGTDRADQDGNNGCGNDDDFDDDNNGHCGKPTDDNPPAPDCTGDMNPNNNHICDKGTTGKITICHATGSSTNPWVVITISENAWPAHQAHGDMYPVPAGGCPRGTDDTPPGKVTICHATGSSTNPWVVITVSEKSWPAHQAHGDKLWDGTSCDDSNPPTKVCPAGTDMAGEPIPGSSVKSCNGDDGTPPDIVLGDDLSNDKRNPKPDVLADTTAKERGKTLPFTGASIIAYLVLALELIGAGLLISRVRRRTNG